MRLLYAGALEWGTTSLQRMEIIRGLVEHVYAVNLSSLQGEHLTRSTWARLQVRLGRGPLIRRVVSALVRESSRYAPDVVWVDQGVCVSEKALMAIRDRTGAILVHYTPDSLMGRGFGNACFGKALRQYDLCITNKPHEQELYRARGAKQVLFSPKGFAPDVHKPAVLSDEDKAKYACDVAFIGQRMKDRARSLARLVERVPCRLHLYGRQWEKGTTGAKLGRLQRGWVPGQEYAKAICGARICLGFLNREVGDTYTSRTFEIPACGGFLLAERTDLQREYFAEDKEAVYFESDDELIEKVKFYLAHEDLRRRIAEAGHHRAWHSGYACTERLRKCIEACERCRAARAAGEAR